MEPLSSRAFGQFPVASDKFFALDEIAPLPIEDRFALGQTPGGPIGRTGPSLPPDLINNTATVSLDSVFCGGQFAKGLE